MKKKSIRIVPVLVAGLAALTFAGCAKRTPDDVSTRSGDPQSPGALQDSLSTYSFEKREEFASQFRAKQAEFDAQVRELDQKIAAGSSNQTGESEDGEYGDSMK
jgi:hypothetical protein